MDNKNFPISTRFNKLKEFPKIVVGSISIYGIKFSPNDEYLAVTGYNYAIAVYVVKTQEIIFVLYNFFTDGAWKWHNLRWFNNNTELLAADMTSRRIAILNIKYNTIKNILTFTNIPHVRSLLSVSLNPDQSKIAIGLDDGKLRIFSFNTLQIELCEHISDHSNMTALAWAPNTDRIAICEGSYSLFIYNCKSKEKSLVRTGHKNWIKFCIWSPCEGYIFSSSDDGKLCIIDARTLSLLHAVEKTGIYIYALHSCNKFERLWAYFKGSSTLISYDYSNNNQVIGSILLQGVNAVAFSNDGKYVVTGGDIGDLILYEIAMN